MEIRNGWMGQVYNSLQSDRSDNMSRLYFWLVSFGMIEPEGRYRVKCM